METSSPPKTATSPASNPPFGVITTDAQSGYRLVRVNAPGVFSAPGFKEFLECPGVATWHVKGQAPGEFSDVFLTLDGEGDGSNSPLGAYGSDTVPPAVWAELLSAVRSVVPRGACLVWLTNLGN